MALACSQLGTYESSSSLAGCSRTRRPCPARQTPGPPPRSTRARADLGQSLTPADLDQGVKRGFLTLGEESVTAPRRALGRTLAQASWAAVQSAEARAHGGPHGGGGGVLAQVSAAFTISLTPCQAVWCQCCARTRTGTAGLRPALRHGVLETWTMASACL